MNDLSIFNISSALTSVGIIFATIQLLSSTSALKGYYRQNRTFLLFLVLGLSTVIPGLIAEIVQFIPGESIYFFGIPFFWRAISLLAAFILTLITIKSAVQDPRPKWKGLKKKVIYHTLRDLLKRSNLTDQEFEEVINRFIFHNVEEIFKDLNSGKTELALKTLDLLGNSHIFLNYIVCKDNNTTRRFIDELKNSYQKNECLKNLAQGIAFSLFANRDSLYYSHKQFECWGVKSGLMGGIYTDIAFVQKYNLLNITFHNKQIPQLEALCRIYLLVFKGWKESKKSPTKLQNQFDSELLVSELRDIVEFITLTPNTSEFPLADLIDLNYRFCFRLFFEYRKLDKHFYESASLEVTSELIRGFLDVLIWLIENSSEKTYNSIKQGLSSLDYSQSEGAILLRDLLQKVIHENNKWAQECCLHKIFFNAICNDHGCRFNNSVPIPNGHF